MNLLNLTCLTSISTLGSPTAVNSALPSPDTHNIHANTQSKCKFYCPISYPLNSCCTAR